ncbi:MAG TPA: NAD(P)-dependent oxidoreductase [Rhizobiales bacterium]|nr:NAD(P)-dependent oxidoreductase [Hyphomicrobiales bacterium]
MDRADGHDIAMIGFGEAARAFAAGWRSPMAGRLAAYDIKCLDDARRPALEEAAAASGVACCATPADAVRDAAIVFCLVTADQAVAAAEAAAPHLRKGAFWLDGNSCSPGSKRSAAALIDGAGGRYVDMAIMAPVHPALHRTASLLSGPHAEAAQPVLAGLDMNVRVAGPGVGDASSIKMLRSVMIKGFEALTAECLLAAHRAGVEEAVLASLQASDPGWDWKRRGAYNLERMLVHGARRAAEMREAAATLRELGLPDRMAAATAAWQDEIATLGLPGGKNDLADRARRILSRLE